MTPPTWLRPPSSDLKTLPFNNVDLTNSPWDCTQDIRFALKITSITAKSAHVISTSILNLCDVPRGAGGRAHVYKLFECVQYRQVRKVKKIKIKPIVLYQSCLVKFNPFDCVLFRKMNLLQSMQIDFTIRW